MKTPSLLFSQPVIAAALALGLNLSLASLAHAKDFDLTKDFDSLGTDEHIVERAKAFDAKNRVRIVQKRTVDRNNRFELSGGFGLVAGGDAYLNSFTPFGQLEFHFTPQWSFGARYSRYINQLTSEGRQQADRATSQASLYNDRSVTIADIDYPIQSTLATISWYPIYGKFNFFDIGITQFDFYALAGGGMIELRSGSTGTFTAGGGVGVWWSQHIMSRLEMRYQTYRDQTSVGSATAHTGIAMFSMGILL